MKLRPEVKREIGRVAQAVVLASAVSVGASLAWNWLFYRALPLGAGVGIAWAAGTIVWDRRRRSQP